MLLVARVSVMSCRDQLTNRASLCFNIIEHRILPPLAQLHGHQSYTQHIDMQNGPRASWTYNHRKNSVISSGYPFGNGAYVSVSRLTVLLENPRNGKTPPHAETSGQVFLFLGMAVM